MISPICFLITHKVDIECGALAVWSNWWFVCACLWVLMWWLNEWAKCERVYTHVYGRGGGIGWMEWVVWMSKQSCVVVFCFISFTFVNDLNMCHDLSSILILCLKYFLKHYSNAGFPKICSTYLQCTIRTVCCLL